MVALRIKPLANWHSWHPFRWLRAIQLLLIALVLIGSLGAQESPLTDFTTEQLTFFESEVRPLLARRCYECHSQDQKIEAGLRLDSRVAMLAGGDSGPAIAPSDPTSSLLIDAVHYRTFQMPPSEKLPAAEIATLERWIALGAPWPAETPSPLADRESFEVTQADRDWWAYRPLESLPAPKTLSSVHQQNPIDAFIDQKLDEADLQPTPSTDDARWLRRIWYDTLGLIPDPDSQAHFLADSRPDRRERELDRLLASPHYGQRWARHWLDVVRYAQTNGYERDDEKPEIWRYRDWVINAFNHDLPYDHFVLEQIAGDELPDASPQAIVATGFQRLGVWDDEPDDAVLAEFDERDDALSTIGTAFLATTIGCARCHRHMFDPISQQEYYSLLSFVRNVRRYERPHPHADSGNLIPLGADQEVAAWRAARQERIATAERERDSATDDAARQAAEQRLQAARDERPPFEFALAVREMGAEVPETQVLARGNPATPVGVASPQFPEVLGGGTPNITPITRAGVSSSGRRLALAQWIASPTHPLTARVAANRLWHQLLGSGIVPTTGDFGRAGLPPSHPELLDHLADNLIRHEWSIKWLHRQIATSATYARDALVENSAAALADPNNRLLWRGRLRRRDAEGIRDAMLMAAGSLNSEMGGRGFFPQVDGEVVAGGSRPGLGWDVSSETQRRRRSIYSYLKRGLRDPLVESFDYTNTTSPLTERPVTTVAPQALILLNSRWTATVASELAQRVRQEVGGDPAAQWQRLFQITLGRDPLPQEHTVLEQYRQQRELAIRQSLSTAIFRPDVPESLATDYLRRLPPEGFLEPPSEDWQVHRGIWGNGYEGIETIDRDRRPFALHRQFIATSARFSGQLSIDDATERASLLLQGDAQDHAFRGLELRFEPKLGTLSLLRIGDSVELLHQQPWTIDPEGLSFDIQIRDQHVTLRLQQHSAGWEYEFDQPQVIGQRWGVAAWGAPIAIRDGILTSLDNTPSPPSLPLAIDPQQDPARAEQTVQRMTLQEMARLMLNLNEFLYVD